MMFAPAGYVPLSSIFGKLLSWPGDERFERAFKIAQDVTETALENDSEEAAIMRFFRVAPMDWLEADALRRVWAHSHIASPDGRVMRLDQQTLNGTLDFAEFTALDLQQVANTNPDLGAIPAHFFDTFRLFNYPPAEFIAEYKNFKANPAKRRATDQPKTPYGPWDFAREISSEHLHHLVPMYYERSGMTITLQAFDYLNKEDFFELEVFQDIARIIRPFEGWALCIPEDCVKNIIMKDVEDTNILSKTIMSEERAYREAQKILKSMEGSELPRQRALRQMIATQVGERQWHRVVGRLRPEFPDISRSGSPRKD